MSTVEMNAKAVEVLLKEMRVDVAYLRGTEDVKALPCITKQLRRIDFLERVALNGYTADTSNELYAQIARNLRPIEESILFYQEV